MWPVRLLIARAGKLSTADAATLEAHLAGCASCRELARLVEPVDRAVAFADTKASEPLADTHGDATAARQDHDSPEAATNRYRITGEVGRGGIGRVLRARDRVLDRSVALKEVFAASDKRRERFIREALITARLQHPSIVPVHDVGHRDGRFAFYSMKLVAGRPLDKAIAEASTSAQRFALLPIVLASADAMTYAHSERIIHRDLKPANVLVGRFGETVVHRLGPRKGPCSHDGADLVDGGGGRGESVGQRGQKGHPPLGARERDHRARVSQSTPQRADRTLGSAFSSVPLRKEHDAARVELALTERAPGQARRRWFGIGVRIAVAR